MNSPKNKPPLFVSGEKWGQKSSCKLNPNTKRAAIIKQFLQLGERGMNCFEAANRHHDYVLRSTVSDIQREYGVMFFRKMEQVPNAFGKTTDCMRYWIAPNSIPIARELVGEIA